MILQWFDLIFRQHFPKVFMLKFIKLDEMIRMVRQIKWSKK